MAWRLNRVVLRGVLDNRVKGKVTGAIWLTGHESPVRLDLEGTCDDDLAGCLVEFTNHNLKPGPSVGKFCDQVGTAGNITASRRLRAIPPDFPAENLTREVIERAGWSNSLYLEWFSDFNGRVVVELLDPEIRISEPAWVFTAEEKAKREKPSEQSAGFIRMITLDETGGEIRKLNEFHYEKVLEEFDDYVLRFEELWQKYKDDPDCDQKIADELGCSLIDDGGEQADYPDEEFVDTIETDSDPLEYPEPLWYSYPLIVRAKDLCVAVSEFGKSKEQSPLGDRLEELRRTLVQGMEKLADGLHGIIAGDEQREPPLLVALLKRSLNKFHLAMEILDELPGEPSLAGVVSAWRTEMLCIRQQIIDEMSKLREKDRV